jgi:hypothetical protein
MLLVESARFRTGEGDPLRAKLVVAFVLVLIAQPAVAWADGPSGSKEKNNVVKCGEGTDTPVGRVYAGANGVELCSDDNSSPDGRVMVSFDGQYIAADGDSDNGAASGFARLDSSGLTCSTTKNQDASSGPGGPCG